METNTVHIAKTMITVRAGDLKSAPFQRPIKEEVVKKIVDQWDEHRFDSPRIANDGGQQYVWDGQHRVSAVRMKFGDDALIDCVYDEMGYKEAARQYAEQDRNRVNLSSVDKFRALIEAEDPETLEIKRILDKYGLRVGGGTAVTCINAVQGITAAYRSLGALTFETMIRTMQAGFRPTSDLWKDRTIRGMTKFYKTYMDNYLDENRMVNALSHLDLATVYEKAITVNKNDKHSGFAYCIATEYNRGKRTNRLDSKKMLTEG